MRSLLTDIPVFWEQQGLQTFGQKIQITRSQMASQPAFEKHFSQLTEEYSAVHGINLLGSRENETVLTSAYSQHLKHAKANGSLTPVGLTHYDFHSQVKLNGHENLAYDLRLAHGYRGRAFLTSTE